MTVIPGGYPYTPLWFGVYVHCYLMEDHDRLGTHRLIRFRDGSVYNLGNEVGVVPAKIPRNWFAVLVEEH